MTAMQIAVGDLKAYKKVMEDMSLRLKAMLKCLLERTER